MTAPQRAWAAGLLYTWFERLGPSDWFGGSDDVDALLKARFADSLAMLGHRPADEFLTSPATARAAILLFDQIPRNLYRDDPRAFAWDRLALAIAYGALARGWDRGIGDHARQFLAMPFMHAEDILAQRVGLAFYARHRMYGTWRFARAHHRMIARFGRFPHRNEVLGRKTTLAEQRAIAAGFSW